MAERLFQGIADQIVDLIRSGAFPPGSRLPGERDLAERFKVSRVTIREAEIALQAQGILTIKTGAGVYVCDDPGTGKDELPQVSALELTEARSLFESEAAALAAPIISEETLARLDELLLVMAEDDSDDEAQSGDRAKVVCLARHERPGATGVVQQAAGSASRAGVGKDRPSFRGVSHGDAVHAEGLGRDW